MDNSHPDNDVGITYDGRKLVLTPRVSEGINNDLNHENYNVEGNIDLNIIVYPDWVRKQPQTGPFYFLPHGFYSPCFSPRLRFINLVNWYF